jgi:hypothetical protein
MYSPPTGRVHCVMTYEEIVTPLRTLPELIRETCDGDAEFEPLEPGPSVSSVTNEGEYAGRMIIRGRHHGRPIAHIVSAIFAEDFSTRLAARVEMDHLQDSIRLVDELTLGDRLALGVRRRRCRYTPPRGWHPLPGLGLEITFVPPDYPRTDAGITVSPAEPLETTLDPLQVEHDNDARAAVTAGPGRTVMTRPEKMGVPLSGEEWTLIRPHANGPGKLVQHLVVLRDSRYMYSAKLDAVETDGFEALDEAFVAMMGSIEGIPIARETAAAPTFEMWND